ncbi:MAG: hypothetical protein ACXWF4_08365, partial [Candidatus Aminicenantales bacterium]
MDAAAEKSDSDIPGIQDLIAGPAPAAVPEAPAEPSRPAAGELSAAAATEVAAPEPHAAFREDLSEDELAADLESYHRTEPADGSGEIHYFQKDAIVIADPEKLLAAVDRTLDEGQRLSVKLGLTESP